ncbi:DUF4397 domain-containing protein [Umezawaea sp. Da 62-37]|uniref:DUF4397 domain-containing protein n=1 Tax=Umezawaea sp. Da 62-37 TaxID=3075927 RepID=UPI0028F6DDFD|nr:DUF4397 domain-containing protein [Umezawaea sp. Da 62-37]WNV82786.1 DUF4397 domain-containing protein [Umezawaea sp. Da 62-37]
MVLIFLLVLAPSARAATGTYLRLAHLAPGTAGVDVLLTPVAGGTSVLTKGVDYGDLLDYRRIEAGDYTIEWRPLGAEAASKPLLSATVHAVQGRAYTVAGLGTTDKLSLKVLDDDVTLPQAGKARLRMINAAPGSSSADLLRDGSLLIQQAVFAEPTLYALVDPGSSSLQVTPRGAGPVTLAANLEASGVYTVLVLELDGEVTAMIRADAKSSEVVPGGGQETGFGGMADGHGDTPWPVVPFAAVLVCAGVLWSRRDRTAS